jgi:regulator of sigma E protease
MVPAATEITDSFGNIHRIGRIGVSQQTENVDITHYRPDPVEAAFMTVEEIRFIVDRTFAFIGDFFVGRGDFRQLGGPLEIADATGEAASLGPEFVIGLAALLSLNLGIFNLLPIPMLDGGHVVFYLAEAIMRRPLSQRVQEIGFRFGFAFLVSILALVTVFNTIPAIIRGFS